jgi:trans-aconitate 2-methyltransferase
MTTWDPSQYLRFADHRLRPAIDLLARVPLDRPEAVVDLGCGPGTSTRLLRERWPDAQVSGIDDSTEMLARAASEWGSAAPAQWVQADLASWAPASPLDLVFTNAALQWLPDHPTLIPRLASFLKPGGVLAIQMPRNGRAVSHSAQRTIAEGGPWRDRVLAKLRDEPVAEPPRYYDLLSPLCSSIDLWESEFTHVLQGGDAVLQWTRGSSLRPLLGALTPDEQVEFEAQYKAILAAAYPRRADGTTLYPFKRLFIVATRR